MSIKNPFFTLVSKRNLAESVRETEDAVAENEGIEVEEIITEPQAVVDHREEQVESVVEEVPAEEVTAEESTVEESTVEEVSEVSADEVGTEDTVTEEVVTEESVVEGTISEENTAEETTEEESDAEGQVIEVPVNSAEEPAVEEVVIEESGNYEQQIIDKYRESVKNIVEKHIEQIVDEIMNLL